MRRDTWIRLMRRLLGGSALLDETIVTSTSTNDAKNERIGIGEFSGTNTREALFGLCEVLMLLNEIGTLCCGHYQLCSSHAMLKSDSHSAFIYR